MRLVVNTNILFSFFNEKSKARELSTLPELELHSPSFSLEEIEKNKSKILKKFSLSEPQFSLIINLLRVVVKFAPKEEYSEFFHEAKEISPDPDDVDFFALALKLNCPIWSEDKLLKKQSRIKVFSTSDLTELLGL
jgi:predicted nucleic acid-binding protein